MSLPTSIQEGRAFYVAGHITQNQHLFCVNNGTSIVDALSRASDLLSMTADPIQQAGMGEAPLKDNQAWLVHHALTSAKAVIDSIVVTIEQAELRTAKKG